MRTPSGRSASFTRLDPVRLLHAQLLGAAHDALPVRHPGGEREERQLVDERRHLVGARPRSRRARPDSHLEVGDRLAADDAAVEDARSARPSARARRGSPVRVGFTPTPWSRSSEPGEQRRRDEERRRRGEVARDVERRAAAGRSAGQTAGLAPPSAARGRPAPRASARCGRGVGAGSTTTVGPPVRVEARRGGRTTSPARSRPAARSGSGCERAALDDDRRVPVRRLDARAHLRAAARRPAPAAGGESDSSPTSSKRPSCPARMPGEQPHQRARRCRSRSARAGGSSPRRPDAVRRAARSPSTLHLGPEGAHGRRGRERVLRGPEARDLALAVGDRAEQERRGGRSTCRRGRRGRPRIGRGGLDPHRLQSSKAGETMTE